MFELRAGEKEIQTAAGRFAEAEVAPRAAEIDRKAKFPRVLVRKMAEQGLFGIPFPKKYGGAGATLTSYVAAVEELSKASASVGFLSAAGLISAFPFLYAGTEEQKEKFLRPLCLGEKQGAFALTEPSAGSDPLSIKTTAVREGEGGGRGGGKDEFVLNGRKAFVTNTAVADIYLVFAQTEKGRKGEEKSGVREKRREGGRGGGLSAFVVEKGTKGFSFAKIEELLGMRGCLVGGLTFDDCRVPAENLLGKEGDGFRIAMATLDRDRIAMSSIGVGVAQACLDASKKYAKERRQFGQPIANFQAVQFMLADIAVETEAARLLTYKAASLADKGDGRKGGGVEKITKEAAMAKLYASEVAQRAATNAVQIHGGFGCTKDCPAERYFRDARVLGIAVGTSEIQRLVIAREVLR